MAETNTVPVRESVGAALRFVRENLRAIAITAAIGAAAISVVTGLGLSVPQVALLTGLLSGLVQAFVYAIFINRVLGRGDGGWWRDGIRTWAAMAVIAFFLFIVFFVLTIPVMIALFAGPMAPYVADLQGAGSDNAEVMRVMLAFAEANPGTLLVLTLFYGVLWLLLTSRLYLAAPATVDQNRILTFETWSWTKGAMLRITWARLLLLAPANILAGALGHLAGRAVGVNTLDASSSVAAVSANPAGFMAYVFVATFITLALYASLEAGLSSYLYRGLKPAAPAPAPAV